jgi:PAS domain S-box-containing protein
MAKPNGRRPSGRGGPRTAAASSRSRPAKTDSTEKALQRAQQALRLTEERFRTVLTHSLDAAYQRNLQTGGIDYMSPAIEQLTGFSPKEMSALNYETFADRIHLDDRQWVKEERARVIAAGRGSGIVQYRFQHKDGIYRWLTDRFSVLPDEHGRALYKVGSIRDITRRKVVEEELAKLAADLEQRVAQRTAEIETINADLRHEMALRQRLETEILQISEREQSRLGQELHDNLGQQLTGISMMLAAFQKKLQSASNPAARDAATISRLLQDALLTTRTLAKGLFPTELGREGLIFALTELVARVSLMSGVECVMRQDKAFSCERATAIHLYRIAQEALHNAIKHGKPKHITIDCSGRGGVTTITITDDGVGFRKNQGQRRGMGLDIFQHRARIIGATLDVRRGDTGGCVVTCRLNPTRPTTVPSNQEAPHDTLIISPEIPVEPPGTTRRPRATRLGPP